MDFKSYRKENMQNGFEKNEENVKSVIEEYSSMSEESLMEELTNRYKEEVKSGKMDKERLEKIATVLDAYLNETQREKLKNIIGKLQE